MKHLFKISIFLTLISIGCSSAETAKLQLEFSDSPIDLQGVPAKFAANVSYNEKSLNAFDIFIPKASSPTPLVIFIHGGGFVRGDKADLYTANSRHSVSHSHIRQLLSEGIAFASLNYRLLTQMSKKGVIDSLHDSKYALQFIRFYAKELNIDKDKLVLVGQSAGAGTSLWIGLQDDLAEKQTANKILKESTRVSGIVAFETQATYDILRWNTDVFKEYDFSVEKAIQVFPVERLLHFYGVLSRENIKNPSAILNTKKIKSYRNQLDMLELISADDPEIYVQNVLTPIAPPETSLGVYFHHPYHVRLLKEQALKKGASGVFRIGQDTSATDSHSNPTNESFYQFILRKVEE